jgi:putative toxin-antitoxin system antitoxin component (TIGR02293 family)
MTSGIDPEPAAEERELAAVIDLLGGPRSFGGAPDPLVLHDRLVRGLPRRALKHFLARCPCLAEDPALPKVLGLALSPGGTRTRRKLSSHQSSQLLRIALVVAKAAPLFGGIDAADRWLVRPTLGLGGRRPLDLLVTPIGSALVADYLQQMAFGVYV